MLACLGQRGRQVLRMESYQRNILGNHMEDQEGDDNKTDVREKYLVKIWI